MPLTKYEKALRKDFFHTLRNAFDRASSAREAWGYNDRSFCTRAADDIDDARKMLSQMQRQGSFTERNIERMRRLLKSTQDDVQVQCRAARNR